MFEDLFYQRLIKLRTEKGVSARDMSLSIGQSPGYINSLEIEMVFHRCRCFSISASISASLQPNFLMTAAITLLSIKKCWTR